MFAWFRDGYFPESLEIKCGATSNFLPLREFKNSIPRSNFFDFLDPSDLVARMDYA